MQYAEYIQPILFFGLLGLILLKAAESYGFFRLPESRSHPVSLKIVLYAFAIYIGMTMLVAPGLIQLILLFGVELPAAFFGWFQLGILVTIFALFYLHCKAQSPTLFKKIWKDRSIAHPRPVIVDFLIGVMTWFIAFPLVIAIGELADMILHLFFGFESYEQVAVRYLKTTLESPSMLSIALFTILIAAPVIEEFLFRGCLQTYFKRHMSSKYAICLSALCFALFHFSSSQGLGNFSLVASLFLFALFLGFIYERQGSLFASVGLHMTFNTVSTLRILFFPE
jgi:membrane protease YdiL (CAAX protease family)